MKTLAPHAATLFAATPARLAPARPTPKAGAAHEAATQFAAVALGELLQPMFDTLPQNGGTFGGGAGEAAFRPLLVQHMAEAIARQGGLGLSETIAQAMLRLQETQG